MFTINMLQVGLNMKQTWQVLKTLSFSPTLVEGKTQWIRKFKYETDLTRTGQVFKNPSDRLERLDGLKLSKSFNLLESWETEKFHLLKRRYLYLNG